MAGTAALEGSARSRRRSAPARVVLPAVVASLALVAAACSSGSSSGSGSASGANAVTITRDSAGIPHIRAANFEALGYGEAWAFSQDNFCTLAQDFVTVNGERSKYFGPKGLSLNYSAQTSDTNLNSDLFWQSVKQSNVLAQQESAPPPVGPLPQVKSLYTGFVNGYNAYLASGQLNDPTCKGKPWVRPISLEDMYLRGIQIATEASSAQFITDEVNAAPPAGAKTTPSTGPGTGTTGTTGTPSGSGTTGTTAPPAGTPSSSAGAPSQAQLVALGNTLRENAGSSLGSNGIGLGSQDTQSGNGMVLANPHFPWRGTERFWMAQLTVPGQYNVLGGTLEGFPLIGIGFNQDLAWTHTVSTDFRFTFYQLKLVPGDPTSYYVDGKVEKMVPQTVKVDNGHGTTTHTFYNTRWGRVLVVPQAGYHWTATTAYAVDDSTISDTFRAANQYLRMGQATSVENLLAVESKYLAIPTFNTIAADNTGHALYADVGNTPNVPQSLITACTPSGTAQLVYAAAGVVTLDGSRSACAWQNDPGTPVPGIFNATHLPHTIRTDYVENSNDSYWLANPSAPFPAYSPIIGKINTQQDYRTRLGNQLIAARVAGTDGLGPAKFTIPTLQQMWEGDQSEQANLVLGSLVSACRATPQATASNGTVVNLTQACTALAGYDKTGHLNASGGWLFSVWAAYAPSTGFWADSFNPAAPLTTPNQLNTANPAILKALANAVLNLQSHHVALNATYAQVQHVTRNGVKIPIPGCDTGCFNAIYAANATTTGPLAKGPYGEVHTGSSLVMTTQLTPQGPVSEGILTYSQATNPKSPWYSNMTTLYSQGKWVPLRYTAAALAHDPGAHTFSLTDTATS